MSIGKKLQIFFFFFFPDRKSKKLRLFLLCQRPPRATRPGSVVFERSPGMREVGGSIPGSIKQKTLKFEDRMAGSESE